MLSDIGLNSLPDFSSDVCFSDLFAANVFVFYVEIN
jgi:hypothetical protein